MPFIQVANRFEKRILVWDGEPTKNPTKDKRFIWIDLIGRWKIEDPLKFLQTVNNEFQAVRRLDDILESQTKTIVSGEDLIEIVRNSNRQLEKTVIDESAHLGGASSAMDIKYGRDELRKQILSRAKIIVAQYGIDLVDVQIKRLNYTTEVREKIYDRMIAERKRAAEKFRSEGEGKKAETEGKTVRELARIESEAYRKTQEIRGKADAEATAIYADAYNQGADFYDFTKSLETYKATIDSNSTLILGTDNDYLKFLKKINPQTQ
jgi:membrane protease subunit HflC